jgi:hypothetical protein
LLIPLPDEFPVEPLNPLLLLLAFYNFLKSIYFKILKSNIFLNSYFTLNIGLFSPLAAENIPFRYKCKDSGSAASLLAA